jgi:hypothetical protein
MESEKSSETMFELDDITLPVFRICNTIRYDETVDDLRLMNVATLPTEDGGGARLTYYYWDASDRWYKAVNIVMIKPAPLWMRLLVGNRIIIANYQLQLLEERPREWRRAYNDMMGLVGYRSDKTAEARASLRTCDTSLKVVAWLKMYLPPRWPYRGL